MMVALGEAYEKLDKHHEAKKCFWRAHSLGDFEGLALFRLARVYECLGECEQVWFTFALSSYGCMLLFIPFCKSFEMHSFKRSKVYRGAVVTQHV